MLTILWSEIWILWETNPINEKTNVSPLSTFTIYFPSKSVAVPLPVPGTDIVTPGIGSPFISTTVPIISTLSDSLIDCNFFEVELLPYPKWDIIRNAIKKYRLAMAFLVGR